jgi:hypothetical protein
MTQHGFEGHIKLLTLPRATMLASQLKLGSARLRSPKKARFLPGFATCLVFARFLHPIRQHATRQHATRQHATSNV